MRRLDRHMTDCAEFHRRRSASAVRQRMDACGGTPYISSSKQLISNQRGMMKHGHLLYAHDKSVTSKFPASQDIRLSMRCLRYQRVDHKRFPTNRSASMIQFYISTHNLA